MMITLLNSDFRQVLPQIKPVRMIFADPIDNIGLNYNSYNDRQSEANYRSLLCDILWYSRGKCDILWISFNAIHLTRMGTLVDKFLAEGGWEFKPCVQTFTFGQCNQYDLGNNYRPLWRLMKKGAKLYPNAVRVPSWRQLHGDKRADPRGRVPSDNFDFPRVTGNSKQRRKYHPTQLHEGLYERCIRLTCKPTDTVCDIFAGTGTLARVCATTGNPCILIDIDAGYCKEIAKEHGLMKIANKKWQLQ